jgi:hypothetical protein
MGFISRGKAKEEFAKGGFNALGFGVVTALGAGVLLVATGLVNWITQDPNLPDYNRAEIVLIWLCVIALISITLAALSYWAPALADWSKSWWRSVFYDAKATPVRPAEQGLAHSVQDDLLRDYVVSKYYAKLVGQEIIRARELGLQLFEGFEKTNALVGDSVLTDSKYREKWEKWQETMQLLHRIRLKFCPDSDLDPNYTPNLDDLYELAEAKGVPLRDRHLYVSIAAKRRALDSHGLELRKLLSDKKVKAWERIANEVASKIRSR